jgi:hypothetical protein
VAGSASKAPAAGTTEATALIGDVAESDAQHRKRHPIIRSDCPRCQYMKYGPQWENITGLTAPKHTANAQQQYG